MDEASQFPTKPESAVPPCLTVKEVMAIYKVSRCTAYAQAARYLERGPGFGIPCIKLGGSLRFPVAWIEAHIGRPIGTPEPTDRGLSLS
jgi:hypothetical protein